MQTAILTFQILDEDLQIVRGTLAAIKPELQQFSQRAADTVQEALEKLDQARREFARVRTEDGVLPIPEPVR